MIKKIETSISAPKHWKLNSVIGVSQQLSELCELYGVMMNFNLRIFKCSIFHFNFFLFEEFEFYNPVSCVEEFNKDLEVFKAIPKQLWILEFWLFCIFCRWTLNKTSLMTDTPFYLNVFHWILARMIKFLLLSSPRSLNHRKPSISLWNSDRKWLFCKIFNCKLWVVNSIIKIG